MSFEQKIDEISYKTCIDKEIVKKVIYCLFEKQPQKDSNDTNTYNTLLEKIKKAQKENKYYDYNRDRYTKAKVKKYTYVGVMGGSGSEFDNACKLMHEVLSKKKSETKEPVKEKSEKLDQEPKEFTLDDLEDVLSTW